MLNHTNKIRYLKGIWVSNHELIQPYFFFEEINDFVNELNEVNQISQTCSSIKSLLKEIENVKNKGNEYFEYEIDTNLVTFTIQKEMTFVKNYSFSDTEIIQLPTEKLIEILKEKEAFHKKLTTKYLLSSIKNGLSKLSTNSIRNKYNLYEVKCHDDLHLFVAINKDAIENLDIDEYMNSLQISKYLT